MILLCWPVLLFHQIYFLTPKAVQAVAEQAHLGLMGPLAAHSQAAELIPAGGLVCQTPAGLRQPQARVGTQALELHMVAAGSAALACLEKAETAVVMQPEQLKTEAQLLVTEQAAAERVVVGPEGTDLMDICGLLTGALTDGNF
jgi:hypothetical protein